MAIASKGGSGYVTGTTKAVNQVDLVTVTADVASNTSGKYFLISTTAVDYYVWNNVGGVGVNPNVLGRTAVAVNYSAGSSASTIAAAILSALTSISGSVFSGTASGANINVNHVVAGYPFAPISAGTSDWTAVSAQDGATVPGPFQVPLFTTPIDADYIYEVEIQANPNLVNSASGAAPTAGIVWGLMGPSEGVLPENVSGGGTGNAVINGEVIASTGTSALVRAGGRFKFKVGPNALVNLSGWAYAASLYGISYNYVGYKIT